MSENTIKRGFTDEAARTDQFDIGHYISGLTKFIENCNTPMTIAIQGEWGSGKTSVMNMVRDKLDSKINTVFFNTWQYSQFNMSDELAISFLTELIESLNLKKEELKKTFGKSIDLLRKTVKSGSIMLIESKLGTGVAGKIETLFDECSDTNKDEREDIAYTIKELRHKFEKCISQSLAANKKERLVIFVDDLDRLNPGKAVELLEVLKIFLECPKCVFVLAIDYGVVSRGVKEKYGADFEDEKGRSFFDKIIQVPFKLPVANYDILKYVKMCLADIDIKVKDDNEVKIYTKLINYSIGNNPRSIKRLFNSFLLLNNIVSTDNCNDTNDNKSILFAVLCMQNKYEQLYNYLVGCQRDIDNQLLKKLCASKYDFIIQELKVTEEAAENISDFCQALYNLLDTDNNEIIEDTKLEEFCSALKFSAITSSVDNAPPEYSGAQKIRYEFWKNFEEYAFKNNDKLRGIFSKPKQKYTASWYALRWGNSRIHIELVINTQSRTLSAELYTESNGKELYTNLYNKREIINESIKQEVIWTDPQSNCKICKAKTCFKKELDLTDKNRFQESFDWLIDTSEKMYRAIESYLK